MDLTGNDIPDRIIMDIKATTYKNVRNKRQERIDELKKLDYSPLLLAQLSPSKENPTQSQ